MGTKSKPLPGDCYSRALPVEPLVTLLARDPTAPAVVSFWKTHRESMIGRGDAPESDKALCDEATACANDMRAWRIDAKGKWRLARLESGSFQVARQIVADRLGELLPAAARNMREGGELNEIEHNAVESLSLLLDAAHAGYVILCAQQSTLFRR